MVLKLLIFLHTNHFFNFIIVYSCKLPYSYASSQQEKVWAENSKICKESNNPIYEPTQQAAAFYESVDNTYEQMDKDKTAETENPLYDVGEVTSTLVCREPITP